MTSTLKSFLGILFLSVFFSNLSSAQIINTIAGNGTAGNSGNGGQALSASVQGNDITADAAGNVYFVTDLTIRKISASGIITNFAGNGTSGTGGDGGPAVNAQLLTPRGIGADAAGNVYICDGNRVRRISTSGIITTIAGNLTAGFSGDGGQAIAAQLNAPADVAVVPGTGIIYITDRLNNRVRKITTAGVISTEVNINNPGFIAANSYAIYYTNNFNSIDIRIGTFGLMYSNGVGPWGPDGVSAFSNGYGIMQGLAADEDGNVFLTADNRVRIITVNAYIYTYAGNGVATFGGDGGSAYLANLNDPKGVAVQGGNVYISDKGNYRIRKVNACTGAPAIPSPITGPTTFCNGATYTFSVPASTSAFYYTWSFPSGWTVNGSVHLNSVSVTAGSASGTVSVSAYNLCDTSTAQMQVNMTVSLPMSPASQPYTLCPGNNVQLSVPFTSGVSYQWYLGSNPIGGQTSNTLNVSANGNYTVVGSITGCSNSSVTKQVVSPVASVNGNFVSSFCANDSLMLYGTYGTDTPTFKWQLNGVDILNSNNDTFYAKVAGQYTFVAITECMTPAGPLSITTIDTPTFTISPASPLNFCFGYPEVVSFNSTTSIGVQWKKDGVNYSNGVVMVPTTEGIYSLIATGVSPSNCKSYSAPYVVTADTLVVDIGPLGTGTYHLCHDDTLTLHVDSGNGWTYQWYLGGNPIPGATTPSHVPQNSGWYNASVSYGVCQNIQSLSSIQVNVDTAQSLLYPAGDTHLCPGETIELVTINQSYAYQWIKDGVILPGVTSVTYIANTAGSYTVIRDAGFCTDTSNVVIVTQGATPTPVITQNGYDLSVPSGFVSYQWYLNGSAIPGATSENYTATQDGDYYVVVSDGCEGQSNTVNIVVLSVGNVNAKNNVSIRPNPFSDRAVLIFNNPQREAHSFNMYDMKGALIQKTDRITGNEFTIERGALPAGVYYFQLMKDDSLVGNGKLTIQ